MTSYRVIIWRGDHWMSVWRGFSFKHAIEEHAAQWYEVARITVA